MGTGLVLVNGRVRTMAGGGVVEAVSMLDGRIVAVGSTDQVVGSAGDGAEVVDLHGAAVLPGFIETHMHPVMVGLAMAEAVTSTPHPKTVPDVVATLADFPPECGRASRTA